MPSLRIALMVVVTMFTGTATADESAKPDKQKGDVWMRLKLKSSQAIFDGLMHADFESVNRSARAMHGVGVLEKWLRDNSYVNSSDYEGQLNAFEYANKELIRTSSNRDVDGALKAYLKLSESCVMCHKHVRDSNDGDRVSAGDVQVPAPKVQQRDTDAGPSKPARPTRTVNAPREPRSPTGAIPGGEPVPILQKFMQRKLASSTLILEGLVTDTPGKISRGASELLRMSEEEKWRASNDMMYLQHSREFRDSVRKLQAKAKDGSLDGAALAWIDVTMSCISCHDWVRDVLVVDVRLPERTDEYKRLQNALRHVAAPTETISLKSIRD